MKQYYRFSAIVGGLLIAGVFLASLSQAAIVPVAQITSTTTSAANMRALINAQLANIYTNDQDLNARLAQNVNTDGNPAFNSIHATGGNLAAANKQVTKAWATGLPYTAAVTSVIHGDEHYIAKTTHTAGSTTEPGVGASWSDAWKKVSMGAAAGVSDVAYNEATWNGDTGVAPSKNTVRDMFESLPTLTFSTGLTNTSGTITVTPNTYQAYDADWAGITTNGASLVSAANYAAMRTLLDLEVGTDFNPIAGAQYPVSVSTSTGTGNINIDGASADHYYFNNGASAATYTPVITSPPASGKERGIILTVGGGAGVCTMTWTNVSFIGTAGAAATTTNNYSHYACFIPSSGNAKCKIIAEASGY